MLRTELLRKILPLTRGTVLASQKSSSSSQIDISQLEKEPAEGKLIIFAPTI